MLFKFNVTMSKIYLATATIEAKTGSEAKRIALERCEELFDFNPQENALYQGAFYEVGEADFIPPDEPEK
jgi:hypothetical protein